jgi:hypothetical protein
MNFLVTAIQRLRLSLVVKLAVSFLLIIVISVVIPAIQSYVGLNTISNEVRQTQQANENVRIAENADIAASSFADSMSSAIEYGQNTINVSTDPSNQVYKEAHDGYTFNRDNATNSFSLMLKYTPNILKDLNLQGLSSELPNTIINMDQVIANAASSDPTAITTAQVTWQQFQPGFTTLKNNSLKFKDYTKTYLSTARSNLQSIYNHSVS